MDHCVGCGHALGHSRFCTQCGRPCDTDDWRTGTAERPVVPPVPESDLPTGPGPAARDVAAPQPGPAPPPDPWASSRPPTVPPPVMSAPPAARYPLFADEAEGRLGAPAAPLGPPPAAPPAGAVTSTTGVATGVASYAGHRDGTPRRSRLPWLVGVAVLLVVALVGALLLVAGNDTDPGRAEDTTGGSGGSSAGPSPSTGRGARGDDRPASPGTTLTKKPRRSRPAQITRSLTVEVPQTAAPNQDLSGNVVRYEATNMIDGVPTTCWRMPGSAAGEEIVLTLAEPTKVAQVGMINGYAKTSGDLDWYTGNRRILSAEWIFDDGTTVAQALIESQAMQTLAVKPVTTSTIRLRLVDVSPPGRGRSARNYTAISDLSITGTPA